jgi:hypothetical protein
MRVQRCPRIQSCISTLGGVFASQRHRRTGRHTGGAANHALLGLVRHIISAKIVIIKATAKVAAKIIVAAKVCRSV